MDRVVQSIANAHDKAISCVKFGRARITDDQFVLASCSADKTIKIWSVERQTSTPENETCTQKSFSLQVKSTTTCSGHEQGISEIDWSCDNRLLCSASDDKSVRLWDPSTGQQITLFGHDNDQDKHSNYVFSVAFNPQASLIASGSYDEFIKLWDVRSGKCVSTIAAHSDAVTSVEFSYDGSLLVSGSYDGLCRVWDVSSTQCLRTLVCGTNGHGAIGSVRFTPNCRFVLACTLENRLQMWDFTRKRCVRAFHGHINEKFCLVPDFAQVQASPGPATPEKEEQTAPLPDAPARDMILCGSEADGSIHMWDIDSDQTARVLGPPNSVPSEASPVTVHQDATSHSGVVSVHVNPHAPSMAVSSFGQSLHFWRLW